MTLALNAAATVCYKASLLEPHSKHSNRRWFFLAVATLSQVSIATIHLGIPALIPFIQQELRLSRTEVGLVSSILNGGVVLTALAAGKAVDQFGERLIIGFGTIASGCIVMGMNWVTSFAALAPILLFMGFAAATGTPAGSKAVAGWFRERERGVAMGLRQMGIPLGGAVAALTLPRLALIAGWRLALTVAGLAAICVGLAALRLYQEPPASRLSGGGAQTRGIREIIARRDIWAIFVYVFVCGGGQWCYLSYMELYLTETLRFSIPLAAQLLAIGQICGTGGRIFWGFVSDRIFGGRRKPVLLLVGFLAIFMTVSTSLFSPGTPFWLVSLVVSFLGLTLLGWNGIYLALVSELVGTHVAGLAIGLSNTGAFLGIVVLPPVFGFLVDQSSSYRLAWIALAAMTLVSVSLLPWVKEGKGRAGGSL